MWTHDILSAPEKIGVILSSELFSGHFARNSSHLFTKESPGIQLLSIYYVLLMPKISVAGTHSKILNVRLSFNDTEPVPGNTV